MEIKHGETNTQLSAVNIANALALDAALLAPDLLASLRKLLVEGV